MIVRVREGMSEIGSVFEDEKGQRRAYWWDGKPSLS